MVEYVFSLGKWWLFGNKWKEQQEASGKYKEEV